MDENTKQQRIIPADKTLELESGQTITYSAYQRWLKHTLAHLKPVYKIEETVYFVMRGQQPE